MNEDEILEIRSQIHQFIRLFGVLNPTKTPCGYQLSLSQVLAIQTLEEKMPLTIHYSGPRNQDSREGTG
ncbi:hypothetical protein JZ785_04500 [Alicyclobacillus curvatus]|nr:hypothetical protein JZ785_04500 [Alicyclobacillus curvatus]